MFRTLIMYGRGLLNAFPIVCYLVISAVIPISLLESNHDALSRVGVGFPLSLNNNKTILYSMGLLQYSYDTNDLTIHPKQDGIEILITKARLVVAFGITRPRNEKYNINSKGAVLILETRGTARLSSDGKRAENCQFAFTESKYSNNNQINEVVKKGLFKGLQRSLGEELCERMRF